MQTIVDKYLNTQMFNYLNSESIVCFFFYNLLLAEKEFETDPRHCIPMCY